MTTNRQYTTRRLSIVNALAELFKTIDGTGQWLTDLSGNVQPKMLFWDEVKEYPAVHIAAGNEVREYLPGGHKTRFLSVTIRCYVEGEEPSELLEYLLGDLEFVIEENSRLAYQDPSGGTQMTQDILISSIDTDEGALAPLGVGEIVLQVRY